jgi:hypothetical protein
MSYTKTLIGTITPQGFDDQTLDVVQKKVAEIVDVNFTDIEAAIGADTVLGFGTTKPPAVSSATSGTLGDATTAAKSNHSHDLGDLGLVVNAATAKTTVADTDMLGLMDSEATPTANVLKKLSWAYVKSVLKTYFDGLYAVIGHNHSGVYQPVISGATTLSVLGITPPTQPPYSGTAMAALTGSSTLQDLLSAIDTDIATAATLPTLG